MSLSYNIRQANQTDADAIWLILQQAIERRRMEGSNQWQDGYPNPDTIAKDIVQGYGYVLLCEDQVVAYCAVMVNNEPAYENIKGQWITSGNTDFLVIHRVAVLNLMLGKGLSIYFFQEIERIAIRQGIRSIRVDTNFDNHAMLHILEKLGYQYCGEVLLRESPRKGFEKVLSSQNEVFFD